MTSTEVTSPKHPSHALYQSLQTAYEHFNQELFAGQLPAVIFTVQRQKDVLGYFAPERWVSPEGERCHEIAINPSHMGQSRVIEVLQTLAHEMVHCWQHCFGNPGRACYHNKEWAKKMKTIGLQPTTTGEVGGAITGQHMSDYPLENGRFLQACESLVQSQAFRIPWLYRLTLPAGINLEPLSDSPPAISASQSVIDAGAVDIAVVDNRGTDALDTAPETFLHSTYREVLPEGTFYTPPKTAKNKVKYQCPGCYVGVWGKPGINLICGDCKLTLEKLI